MDFLNKKFNRIKSVDWSRCLKDWLKFELDEKKNIISVQMFLREMESSIKCDFS